MHERREDDIREARDSVCRLEGMATREHRACDGDPILAWYYQTIAARIREAMPHAFSANE